MDSPRRRHQNPHMQIESSAAHAAGGQHAAAGSLGATILSALAGYGFARFKFRGANGLFFAVMAVLMLVLHGSHLAPRSR